MEAIAPNTVLEPTPIALSVSPERLTSIPEWLSFWTLGCVALHEHKNHQKFDCYGDGVAAPLVCYTTAGQSVSAKESRNGASTSCV